ncbi:MAG TPA: ACP S-malonyltransferase [Myxococcaceae bacterium]|nr:ACP S-malonyltransferase [Myxococcaceae bacterium]
MVSTAFLFPGQGSQAVGMGKALSDAFPEARAVFQAADDALAEPLSRLCFDGPEPELVLTRNTQPAILTTSIAAHAVWAARGGPAAFVAGHSLGEYSALVAAGALALPDAVRAVRARGTFMQEAVPAGTGAMAAVLGLDAEAVTRICAEVAGSEVVSPANFNSPEQTVIAGHASAVERASVKLRESGAKRVVPLAVSAPFHTALMEPAKARLAEVLARCTVSAPRMPVVTNVEAAPNADAARVVPLLLAQVSAPVRWVESVRALAAAGVTRVVELGPGRVLGGLVKRISKDIEVLNVEDPASLEKSLAAARG